LLAEHRNEHLRVADQNGGITGAVAVGELIRGLARTSQVRPPRPTAGEGGKPSGAALRSQK
jgi:hypothetical protein